MNNEQTPEKLLRGQIAQFIQLHSMFSTIQGEGPFTGLPALFVRLAGCNLQCPACDTEYTSKRENRIPSELAAEIAERLGVAKLVVITGGEPCRQPALAELIAEIVTAAPGVTVQIETNGTLPLPEFQKGPHFWVWHSPKVCIVCSPKTGAIHRTLTQTARAVAVTYKYVLGADDVSPADGLPLRALRHTAAPQLARPPAGTRPSDIYINPLDEKNIAANARNLQAAKDSCLKYGYRLGVQLHKLIGVE